MEDYGVTENGFILKRMDTILEEVHADLSEGFGFDTTLYENSFLNILTTSIVSQIATLWEVGQEEYYAKNPSTATGLNLDNAVQYGGIRRTPKKQTAYLLHCTGDDGTTIESNTVVATDTNPEVRLIAVTDYSISREKCNSIVIKVAVVENNSVYTVSVNGNQYSYSTATENTESDIINGLKSVITLDGYAVNIDSNGYLVITDNTASRNNNIELSNNLTTHKVTTIASYFTEDYGKISLPNGIVTKIITNVSGLDSVVNKIVPVYGRLDETDIELRQSYIAKSALRSSSMIDSIVGEILSNVPDVESASGYENCTDSTDSRGLPPHSIEIIVEGGDKNAIAEVIARRRAGGIYTHGDVLVNVPGKYGELLPTRFNRPEYLYTWLKVTIHGKEAEVPENYVALVKQSVMDFSTNLVSGSALLTQLLNEGIYDTVAGVNYIDIKVAYSTSKSYSPSDTDYEAKNIYATTRQKILLNELRIGVTLYDETADV